MIDERHERLLDQVRRSDVELIHLQFCDIPGAIKSVAIPANRLQTSLERGVWFDGSSVEGMARVAESDLYLRPDPATFALLPWEARPTGRLLCDICLPDGSPFPADPRDALRRVLAEAADLGYAYRVGCELEFFVFEDRDGLVADGQVPQPLDTSSYFDESDDRAANLCWTAAAALDKFGFAVETTHHEVAPGQFEIDLAETDALAAADAVVALKWALRSFGRREGLLVSFMPKPLEGASGSGMHVQQVLAGRDGANAFTGGEGEYGLSAVGERFIAGQLAHARGMTAVIAPLVNSYKRLMGGAEAPARISWARTNRAALIRVPEVAPAGGARVELRAPDPSCNPYLALAVMLGCGLHGVRDELALPPPVEHGAAEDAAGQGDPLPSTLGEALEELDWDPMVRAALGQPIFERFLAAKEAEWADFRRHISLWELQRYFKGT